MSDKNAKKGFHVPDDDENPDPISGAAGAHPLGTSIGAAGGAAAGATIGAVAGPLGAALGTLVGAVAGGLAGKEAAEAIKPTDPAHHHGHPGATADRLNPTVEDDYWRAHYSTRPYVEPGASYEIYRSAYQYGWDGHRRYRGRRFDDVEAELRREWERTDRELSWTDARDAARDAWQRIEGLRSAD
jgi:hypothetical protein